MFCVSGDQNENPVPLELTLYEGEMVYQHAEQ